MGKHDPLVYHEYWHNVGTQYVFIIHLVTVCAHESKEMGPVPLIIASFLILSSYLEIMCSNS